MKSVLLFVMMSVLPLSSFARGSSDSDIDFSRPPFWLPSYEVISNLDQAQVEFYIRGFEKIANQIPSMQGMKKSEILEATTFADGWKDIQTKFYRACQWEKTHEALCKEAAALRKTTILMNGNKKAENRQAEEDALKGPSAESDDADQSSNEVADLEESEEAEAPVEAKKSPASVKPVEAAPLKASAPSPKSPVQSK